MSLKYYVFGNIMDIIHDIFKSIQNFTTDPNILGPTQTFLKTFGILKSIFRLF